MSLDSIIIEKAVEGLMNRINTPHNIEWQSYSENLLLKELALCLLSSNIKYEVALLYIDEFVNKNYFRKAIHNDLTEEEIWLCLKSPVFLNGKWVKYRFPKLKSNQLFQIITKIYGSGLSIKEILSITKSSIRMRELLINLCPGIGYKQASMFLRNIGYGYDLAIVDTHLIDYLKLVEVLPISTKVNNKSIYIKVENLYFEYAFYKQYNINKLDLAIWNVMRLYKSKYLLK